jgi:hypothetical protein
MKVAELLLKYKSDKNHGKKTYIVTLEVGKYVTNPGLHRTHTWGFI